MSLRKSAFQSPEQPSALPNAVLPMHTAINTVKKSIRLGDLLHLDEENVQARLKTMLEAKKP